MAFTLLLECKRHTACDRDSKPLYIVCRHSLHTALEQFTLVKLI